MFADVVDGVLERWISHQGVEIVDDRFELAEQILQLGRRCSTAAGIGLGQLDEVVAVEASCDSTEFERDLQAAFGKVPGSDAPAV